MAHFEKATSVKDWLNQRLAIEKVEKDYLFQLLKKHSGNITRIATDSGMTRRNIHRLIKRYELDPNIWR